MSNQEAIALLRNLEDSLDSYCELNEEGKTAFRMAIESLELFGNSEQLPSADVQPDWYDADYTGGYVKEEDILKFYYVESIDDYWIGRRLDNFYYATWDRELQNFVWSKSRYLPWGEHIIAPETLWKEHTYPSEPKEIPIVDWLKGFYAKYSAADVQPVVHGEWVVSHIPDSMLWECNQCGFDCGAHSFNFCPKCGCKMDRKGADE